MTDVDTRILDIVSGIIPPGFVRDTVAGQLQAFADDQADEAVKAADAEILALNGVINRMGDELSTAKKQNELLARAHLSQTGYLHANDEYLLSVTESKNPVVRLLAKLAKWPSVAKNDLVKYHSVREALAEMHRQDTKWGASRTIPNGTATHWEFERDEAQAATDIAFAEGRGTWRHILTEEVYEAFAETSPRKLKVELIQVAAVALQWWVSLTLQRPKS